MASMLRQRDDRLRLEARLKRPGITDMPLMVRATFAVAVPRHFPPDARVQEIAGMAAATRVFYDQLDLMGTEYLIRAALGEDVPDHGMDVRTEIATKTLVLGAIADWWQRDEARLLDVVVEAEQILADQGHVLAVSDR